MYDLQDVARFGPAGGVLSGVVENHPWSRRSLSNDRAESTRWVDRSHEKKHEAVASIRSLVEKIVVHPDDDPQGRDLELVGQLAALLDAEKASQ